MLKKIHIKNFLSCEDTEIEFDNVTALIGRNAAGKSNILKIIQWVAQYAIKHEVIYEDYFSENAEINLNFLIDGNFFEYIIIINSDNIKESLILLNEDKRELIAKKNNEAITFYSDNQKIINFEVKYSAPLIACILSLLSENDITIYIHQVFCYLSKIYYYDLEDTELSVYNPIIAEYSYKEWRRTEHWMKNSRFSVNMRLLSLWHEDKELLDELKSLVGKNGLGLINNIEIIKNNDARNNGWYTINFYVEKNYVSYNKLSFGTQRVLMILLALLYDKNSTLLIEQPEDGIHLGLLRKVLSICFTYAEHYKKQLIITTHSPNVIDMFHAENIRLVKMTEAGTKVNKLDDELLAILPDYLANEGVLSDFIESMDDE